MTTPTWNAICRMAAQLWTDVQGQAGTNKEERRVRHMTGTGLDPLSAALRTAAEITPSINADSLDALISGLMDGDDTGHMLELAIQYTSQHGTEVTV